MENMPPPMQGHGHFEFPFSFDQTHGADMFTNHSVYSNGTYNISEIPTTSKRGATIVSPLIMFLTGLIGNTLALIVLYRTKTEIRRTMFYTLVAGLAWTDITGQVLTSPISIFTYINGLNWPGGEQLCKFNGFIMGCFGLSTPCLVCAMAVERFLAIQCPFFYSKYCTRSTARVTILLLWGAVLLVCILPLLGFGQYTLQYPGTWCFLNFHTKDPVLAAYGILYAGINLLIMLVMTGCNIYVGATLLKVRFIKKYSWYYHCGHCDLSTGNGQTYASLKIKQQHAVQVQMIWLMCAITTVFVVCCAPLMIQIFRTLITGEADYIGDLMGVRLSSINQILDPWLYILVRRSFLQKISHCCRKLKFWSQSSEIKPERDQKQTLLVRFLPQPPQANVIETHRRPQSLRGVNENDVVGFYTPCPHCKNERQRDHVIINNGICESSLRHLPDLMGANKSRFSDQSLPDVTPEGAMRSPANSNIVDSFDKNSVTSGYYDTEVEPIYVDVFLLPRGKIQSQAVRKSGSGCIQEDPNSGDIPDPTVDSNLPDPTVDSEDISVFIDVGSTSGISSWTNQPPRRPFRSVDVNCTASNNFSNGKQGNERRIKSYT